VEKEDYRKKVETRLDELDDQISSIGKDVGKLEKKIKLQYNKLREPLQVKLEELRKKLGELKKEGDDKWDDIRSDIDSALEDLEKGLTGLVSSMNDYLSFHDIEGDITMTSSEIMTKDPKVCMPEDNVGVAVEIMWDHDCGDVPVVKDMNSRELVGMITDRDIAMSVVKHINAHPSVVKVMDCMSSPVISCRQDDPVETAIQLMGEHKIRRIPVVDGNGGCIGIISQADLLRSGINKEAIVKMLQHVSAPQG
jgi:CBS domain-containing protein